MGGWRLEFAYVAGAYVALSWLSGTFGRTLGAVLAVGVAVAVLAVGVAVAVLAVARVRRRIRAA